MDGATRERAFVLACSDECRRRPAISGKFAGLDPQEAHGLVNLLYDRLRTLARSRMAGQRGGHTLDPTGLANEAVLRLLKYDASQVRDEQHLMSLAVEAMRQILVDHARAKTADKRGGGARAQSLSDESSELIHFRADPAEVLAMNEALGSLETEDPEAANIVKMRAFAGMDSEEIAALLNVSRRTVERRWRYAMAELRARLDDESTKDAADDRSTGSQSKTS